MYLSCFDILTFSVLTKIFNLSLLITWPLNSLKEKNQRNVTDINKCYCTIVFWIHSETWKVEKEWKYILLLLRLMPSWCAPRQFCLYLAIVKDIVVLCSFDFTWSKTAEFNCTFESILFLNGWNSKYSITFGTLKQCALGLLITFLSCRLIAVFKPTGRILLWIAEFRVRQQVVQPSAWHLGGRVNLLGCLL